MLFLNGAGKPFNKWLRRLELVLLLMCDGRRKGEGGKGGGMDGGSEGEWVSVRNEWIEGRKEGRREGWESGRKKEKKDKMERKTK